MPAQGTPDAELRSPEAVLKSLHEHAEHKASLKLFYGAADICRSYCGPFANATKEERARYAAEYEKLGNDFERERKEHGAALVEHPVHLPSHPAPTSSNWHCPACHATFPEGLVVCGKCGFDLRTGKHYEAGSKQPETPPQVRIDKTRVIFRRHVGHHRRRSDTSTMWIIGGTVVVLFLLLVLLGRAKRSWTMGPVPAPQRVLRP